MTFGFLTGFSKLLALISPGVTKTLSPILWGFNFIFASSVAEFALALRDSKYKEDASYVSVIQRLEENLKEVERDPLKLEFLELVRKCIINEIVAR